MLYVRVTIAIATFAFSAVFRLLQPLPAAAFFLSATPPIPPKFMTLPFDRAAGALAANNQPQQGWWYTNPSHKPDPVDYACLGQPNCHMGIDFMRADRRGFVVRAAADGYARYGHDCGGSDCWCSYVYIRHPIDGTNWYTLYAHLAASYIPDDGREHKVARGDPIGFAGMTGGANGVIHLHFELAKGWIGGLNRLDPYGVYGTANYYPFPPEGQPSAWTTDPPSYPGSINPSTPASPNPASDAILKQTENSVLAWKTDATTCDVHTWGGGVNNYRTGVPCSSVSLGLQPAGSYQWQVTAHSGDATTIGPVWNFSIQPSGPTGLQALAVSPSEIDLRWARPSDTLAIVDSFEVHSRDGSMVAAVSSATTNYAIGGLACGSSFSYFVTAVRQGVESAPSNVATASTPVCGGYASVPSLRSPGDASTESRENDTILAWNTDGTTCDVHIWGQNLDITPTGVSCAYFDIGAQPAGSYQWQVAAHNSHGTSLGPIWHFQVQPYPPFNFTATAASATQIDLHWSLSGDDPGGVDSYAVYLTDGTLVTDLPAGTTSYSVLGLPCSTTYSFLLAAVGQGVDSPLTGPVSTTTAACSAVPSIFLPFVAH